MYVDLVEKLENLAEELGQEYEYNWKEITDDGDLLHSVASLNRVDWLFSAIKLYDSEGMINARLRVRHQLCIFVSQTKITLIPMKNFL